MHATRWHQLIPAVAKGHLGRIADNNGGRLIMIGLAITYGMQSHPSIDFDSAGNTGGQVLRVCLDWERKFFECHIGCVGRISGGVFRN